MPSIGAPGGSPFMRGQSGKSGKPNMMVPDVFFDNLLEASRIGCDTENSIETQLEAFHKDVEENLIAYMDPADRKKIKDKQYLQKRDYYRYKPLTTNPKQTYQEYTTIENYLDSKRVNNDEELNKENEVEHIKPDRIHTAAKRLTNEDMDVFKDSEFDTGLFGLNSGGAEVQRSPTSMPFAEETTSNNNSAQGESRYRSDAGGFNTFDNSSMKVKNNFDLNTYLNNDGKSVGTGNDLPKHGEFSTLAEGAAANFTLPDNYYRADNEPVYQEPELDEKLKELLDMILSDDSIGTETKLNALQSTQNSTLQGVPQNKHWSYDEHKAIGNEKDNLYRNEQEGVANVSLEIPGSLASNVAGL